jgi:NitT/TauT family transport system permease protein
VVSLVRDPTVYTAFFISNQSLVFGFGLAIGIGIPLGLLIARFRSAEGYIDPYLSILLVTPMAALIPLLIMSLGLGLASRVVLVVVFSIPVVIVNARAGIRSVDANLIEMATSYGAGERQIWREILLPGALPAIMTGVRLGLGRAVTGMVIIELLMVAVGIGGLILNFRGTFQADMLYAVVVLIVVEALILVSIVRLVERWVAPWSRDVVLRE